MQAWSIYAIRCLAWFGLLLMRVGAPLLRQVKPVLKEV